MESAQMSARNYIIAAAIAGVVLVGGGVAYYYTTAQDRTAEPVTEFTEVPVTDIAEAQPDTETVITAHRAIRQRR
jgi:hypothetical protein